MKPKVNSIVVSVISDLITDQRVHKICIYFQEKGYTVTLIGRSFKESLPLGDRAYKTERIFCYAKKGVAQYAEFNLKLFYKLFFKKMDVLLSNDLDTLLPNYLHSIIRGKRLYYDSHEYFTGTPELSKKPLKRKLWKKLEKFLLPKTDFAITVNDSIANLYKSEVGIEMCVVRNLPKGKKEKVPLNSKIFPDERFVLLLQGAGINKDRGAEELIDAMQYLPDFFLLVFIGNGDAWNDLKERTKNLNLFHKVRFIEKVPFELLTYYTSQAHLGLSLDKPNCINHQLSLPNKIFDYIHANVPILTSNVIEVRKIVDEYNIGYCIEEVSPKEISKAVLFIYNNVDIYNSWKENTKVAAKELVWEKEVGRLNKYLETL